MAKLLSYHNLTKKAPSLSLDDRARESRPRLQIHPGNRGPSAGFTIVELLILVVVIAILATIATVAYSGISTQAKEAVLRSDLSSAAKQLHLASIRNDQFSSTKPADIGTTVFQYTGTAGAFCLTATSPQLKGKAFYITDSGSIESGACPGHTVDGGEGQVAGTTMQAFSSAQCSALAVYDGSNSNTIISLTDSRGGIVRTYEVAKLADGKCWMLTNLKLGSTSGAVVLTTGDSNVASNFTLPKVTDEGFSAHDSPTVIGPTPGDTGSGATNYGYLYNWSAATAGETRDSMPGHSTEAAPHSICPAGWKLPVINPVHQGGSLSGLDIAFGGTGLLATGGSPNIARWQYTGPFKGVLSGTWLNGAFTGQGQVGFIWSNSTDETQDDLAFHSYFGPSEANSSDSSSRAYSLGVRCVAI